MHSPAQLTIAHGTTVVIDASPSHRHTLPAPPTSATTVRRRVRACQTGCALSDACINSIRFLCLDAIEHARSGHPGTPMGIAPTAFVLFDKFLRFNPGNPAWPNRDRFVLSAGHASMLQYAILHLYGYDSVTMDDIKAFRTLGSVTPGHPENTHTPGVEVTTGPLGQGFCNAVGIAMAEAHVAAVYNRPPAFNIIDNYTFCVMGDGCIMEGMTGEAASLAGHLRLSRLIAIYDDNHVSIEGSTDITLTEDVCARFRAYGWNVISVANGDTDLAAISAAIASAKLSSNDKPTLIRVCTTIGFGSPGKANSAAAHGAALGPTEVIATRDNLEWMYPPFTIPPHVLAHFRRKRKAGKLDEDAWQARLVEYSATFPDLANAFKTHVLGHNIAFGFPTTSTIETTLITAASKFARIPAATRKHSQAMLNALAPVLPNLVGGSADLAPSTLTLLACSSDFTALDRKGRNIRFGVREHAMGAISNGIALSGYRLIPYCATFLVFSDYMRAAMRMASLSRCRSIFIMTHDSVGLGEDGATHQPVEHLASLRAMPNHAVWRPADSVETAAAYAMAVSSEFCPHTIVLSRQSIPNCIGTSFEGAKRGAYVTEMTDFGVGCATRHPVAIIVATGSELSLSQQAAYVVQETTGKHIRVVSMPCWEAFEAQPETYKRKIFPRSVGRHRILSVEAGSSFGWPRYADHNVSVDKFGLSAPGSAVLSHFGFTVENVSARLFDIILSES